MCERSEADAASRIDGGVSRPLSALLDPISSRQCESLLLRQQQRVVPVLAKTGATAAPCFHARQRF